MSALSMMGLRVSMIRRCNVIPVLKYNPNCATIAVPSCVKSQHREWFVSDAHARNVTATRIHCRYYTKRVIDTRIDGYNAVLVWEDGNTSRFHSKWLRFSCQCPHCVDSDTNQGQIAIDKLPMLLTLKDVNLTDQGALQVTWKEDCHVGEFTTEFLQEYDYSEHRNKERSQQAKPSFSTDLTVPRLSWTDVEKSDEQLYQWLRYINEEGLCLLTNVPTESYYLKKVIMKIGYPTRALYGEIFDVATMKMATNLAYSSQRLNFHMDHAWYESPTGIQFLHCLRFDESIIGGNTLFVDMYHVVDEFRKKHPEEFRTLCTIPATFWRIHDKRENPVHFVHRRPIISVNENDQVINVSWHAHAIGPPLVNEDNVEKYCTAYQLLATMVEQFPFIFYVHSTTKVIFGREELKKEEETREVRLNEGELISFNNRRLAHGRSAMDNTKGCRHLQGGYVNIDDFKSKLLVLAKKYSHVVSAHTVGNYDWV